MTPPPPEDAPGRVVIDTNVLFSALYKLGSPPGRVLMLAAEDRLELLAPTAVRDELERILADKLEMTDDEIRRVLTALPVGWIEEGVYEDHLPQARKQIDDAGDRHVLALALGLAVPVVTGDADFGDSDELGGVEILTPRHVVDRVDQDAG